MMWWYGSPMGGWGAVFMTITTVLFWGLIILGVIALFRYLNRGDRSTGSRSTPEQVLADRFARGEIDEQEYRSRLAVLDETSSQGDRGERR
jgi:putative membrane protein